MRFSCPCKSVVHRKLPVLIWTSCCTSRRSGSVEIRLEIATAETLKEYPVWIVFPVKNVGKVSDELGM